MTELVLDCEGVAERGLVERYVAGTLDEENVRAFEIHYLACASCQADVLAGASVRSALRVPSRLPIRPHTWLGLGGLALAAALAAVVLIPRNAAREPLHRLGALVEPPLYLGVPVRDADEDSVFTAGMAAYSRREYVEAARLLGSARQSAAVPAAFFRAASLLMSGRSDEAAAEFSRVIAAGKSPYLAEAHYYRAKTHLLRGRADEALADLIAAASDSAIAPQARILADSVRGLSER